QKNLASEVSQVFAWVCWHLRPAMAPFGLGNPTGAKSLKQRAFFLVYGHRRCYSTNTPFRSSLTGSNEESSGKDSFSTLTGMPSLSSCRRISRPLLKRTASRNWYGVALSCTNVTSSMGPTTISCCKRFGTSSKISRAPGDTHTAGFCLADHRDDTD